MSYVEIDTYITDGIKVSILEFSIPLDHKNKESPLISVAVKIVNKLSSINKHPNFNLHQDITLNKDNILLYLQGGPGFPSVTPTSINNPPFLKPLLDRNYTVILLDQRGTGLSTAIDTKSLIQLGDVITQFNYIKNFRADSIVHDCEIIRHSLIKHHKWTLLGQSFGGFASITYASFFPNSLKKIMLTGGLPPLCIDKVDDVYVSTFQRTKERNLAYYKNFPFDKERVDYIANYLSSTIITLPNNGCLTVERFRGLGLTFGGSGGSLSLHNLITLMYTELIQRNELSYWTKLTIMNYLGFETNILYFLLQEAIYINGPNIKSDWAADRVLKNQSSPSSSNEFFLFTGEIVEKSMFDSYDQLKPLKPLADYIHSYDKWSELYNLNSLRKITWDSLPIAAQVYLDDQYVDYELTKQNRNIFEYQPVITNQLFHNGLRADSELVIGSLHRLFDHGEYM